MDDQDLDTRLPLHMFRGDAYDTAIAYGASVEQLWPPSGTPAGESNLRGLSSRQLAVYLAGRFSALYTNGGLSGVLAHNPRHLLERLPGALTEIGAPQASRVVSSAFRLFPGGVLPDEFGIADALSQDTGLEDQLFGLGLRLDRVLEGAEELEELAAAYMRRHREDFFRS